MGKFFTNQCRELLDKFFIVAVGDGNMSTSITCLEQLEQAIVDYIDYYNNKRIKVKLKGLSPVQYRTKSFG